MPITISCKDIQFDNISAVIFDKDGTLENSLEYWRGVGIERARLIDAQIPGVGEPLLMAFGISDNTLDPAGLMAVGNYLENEIAAAAYIAETGRSWHESRKIAQQAFTEVSESKYLVKNPQTAPLFPEVKKTLQNLSHVGLKLGILSADSTSEVETFIKNHQLQDLIKLGMGTDSEITKPDPRLFIQACQALGVTPKQTLMIGDSAGDMSMAKTAGAGGCVEICRHQNSQSSPADIQISRLLEVQTL